MRKSAFLILLLSLPFLAQVTFTDYGNFIWGDLRYYACLLPLFLFLCKFVILRKSFIAHLLLLYGILIGANTLLYRFFKHVTVSGEFIWDEAVFGMTWIMLFHLVVVLCAQRLPVRWTSACIAGLETALLLPYLVNMGYAVFTGDVLDTHAFTAVYQTNLQEIGEFFNSVVPWYGAVLFCIVVAVIFAVLQRWIADLLTHTTRVRPVPFAVLVVLLVGMGFYAERVINYSYFVRIYRESQEYLQEIERYDEVRKHPDGTIKHIDAVRTDADDGVYLLIIGESQNRRHMAAYGYPRATTPWLSRMASDAHFVLYNNGYSCHTLTMRVLSQALSEKSRYNDLSFDKAYSIMDIAHAAGYRTYWISNQVQYGAFVTPISSIANYADYKEWRNNDRIATASYDEDILQSLQNLRVENGSIVVLHLNGNHWEYANRYPKGKWSVFDGTTIDVPGVRDMDKLNEYDNSMLYNDYVVQEIFNYAKSHWNLRAMVYFADHGEAVVNDQKHLPGNYEPDMATIPVYFYFSDVYMAKHREKVEQIRKNRDVCFTNDMMYHALLDLWHIRTPHYRAQENFLSESYAFKKDDLRILNEYKVP